MKKSILAICLLPLASFAQQYDIEGKIDGWKGTDSITLIIFKPGQVVQETKAAENGQFKFSGSVEEPVAAALRLDRKDRPGMSRDNIGLYLEPGKILITSKDSLKHASINAGQLNADGVELKRLTAPFLSRLIALRIKAYGMSPEERKSDEAKALNAEYEKIGKELEAVNTAFIRQHPASYVALETLNKIAGVKITYEKIAPLYEQLDVSLKKLSLGKELAERLKTASHTVSGAVMPNFISLDTARNQLALKDVLRNSKLTLVDFWASWCGPCRAENPNVVKAFEAFHSKGFNIISVSLDDNPDKWKAAIIKDGMPWFHVSGLKKWEEPVAKQFGVGAVPDNFLLDAEGRVIARGLRGEELYKFIQEKLH